MSDVAYRVNGHSLVVTAEFKGDESVQCTECFIRERVGAEVDPHEHLSVMLPECHFEWLREPDDGFHGVAMRNNRNYRGRDLVAIRHENRENGDPMEVCGKVRIYDEDIGTLLHMLDRDEWERREGEVMAGE